MNPETFDLILSILQENPISHKITFSAKGDMPVNNYQVNAKYTTNNRKINTSVLKISHTPSMQMVEIYIGNKCIYAKQCSVHSGKISLNNKTISTSEDDYIVKIIKLCKSKTENTYIKKLTDVQNFLNALKKENQK